MDKKHKNEIDKYIDCYENGTKPTFHKGCYGSTNWGQNLYPYLKNIKINSILDIGCGHGEFPVYLKDKLNIKNVYGLDIASIKTGNHINHNDINWLDAQAYQIPLLDNTVEYITSFDVLEHCLEQDIDKIVSEFHRVCTKEILLKIAYRQATKRTMGGEKLHMTVHKEMWWINKFKKKFTYDGKIKQHYLKFTK